MFERLIDLLVEFVELFQFFMYVDEFEGAVVLRFGKYHRTLGPGAHWILPFGMEDAISVNIKPEPMYLDVQSLHTEDQYLINIQVGFTYKVTCPKTFLLDYEDTEDTIALLVSGFVTEAVHDTSWADLRDGIWLRALKKRANRAASKRGALIDEVIVQDLASGSADRLWLEGVAFNLGDD